jgi:haloacetate dehalogenase
VPQTKSIQPRVSEGFGRRELLQAASALVAGATAGSLAELQAQTPAAEPAQLFPDNFRSFQVETSGATINGVIGGQGPPVLLLHGYPLSHVSWSQVGPKLAKEYTVVATDLRGYGDSSKPPDGVNHAGYSKRAMAFDQVEVMKHFGFDQFSVVGHDRGGRVAHRMALDHADKITRAAVLDIIPTSKFYQNITQETATAYYHWFFLIQRAPMPEKCIESNLAMFVGRGETPTAKEYLRTFRNPATIHAACEDYRAGATIDMEHDVADMGKKVECPLLVLWAQQSPMGRLFDVLATWKERASQASGKMLPGGHNLPEGSPNEVLAELRAFLKA